jgi:hypothetical protein
MKFGELKANWQWMLTHMGDDEPVVFPRRTARRRIANKEKRRRIIFDTDELGYSRFHARKEAWLLELGDNPSLFAQALDECMAEFDLRGWVEKKEQSA